MVGWLVGFFFSNIVDWHLWLSTECSICTNGNPTGIQKIYKIKKVDFFDLVTFGCFFESMATNSQFQISLQKVMSTNLSDVSSGLHLLRVNFLFQEFRDVDQGNVDKLSFDQPIGIIV